MLPCCVLALVLKSLVLAPLVMIVCASCGRCRACLARVGVASPLEAKPAVLCRRIERSGCNPIDSSTHLTVYELRLIQDSGNVEPYFCFQVTFQFYKIQH
jgi:hypothetical protein